MIKVSIILPVYNVEDYLEECLDSIINQTLTDIEIICINDGSTDNSLNILKEYAKKDNRIKIFTFSNSGLGTSRNRGIELASGEYTTFVDSDDWIELNFCEEAYNNAKYHNSDIVLCNAIEEYDDYKKERIYFSEKKVNTPENFVFKYNDEKHKVMNSYLTAWSKLHRTSFLLENNIKFPNIIYEDGPFQVESFIKAKKISYCHDIFYHYRKNNPNSITETNTIDKKILNVLDNINLIENILYKEEVYQEFRIEFLIYKLNQTKNKIDLPLNLELGTEFFNLIKNSFLDMKISEDEIKALPNNLSNFYIDILNSESYIDYKETQLNKKIKELENIIAINKEVKNKTKEYLYILELKNKKLKKENKKLKRKQKEILNSKSWKITKPLRKIGQIKKKIKY